MGIRQGHAYLLSFILYYQSTSVISRLDMCTCFRWQPWQVKQLGLYDQQMYKCVGQGSAINRSLSRYFLRVSPQSSRTQCFLIHEGRFCIYFYIYYLPSVHVGYNKQQQDWIGTCASVGIFGRKKIAPIVRSKDVHTRREFLGVRKICTVRTFSRINLRVH